MHALRGHGTFTVIADLDTHNEDIYSRAGSLLDLSRRSLSRRIVGNYMYTWTGKRFSQPMMKFNKVLCGWTFYAPYISPRYV
jgi:hypothetical protein